MVEQKAVNFKVLGSSPSGGANFDGQRKRLSCQRVLSLHIALNYHSVPSSEVFLSKVVFFPAVQNFQIARVPD
jgi:hypothetical protein